MIAKHPLNNDLQYTGRAPEGGGINATNTVGSSSIGAPGEQQLLLMQ